MEKETTYIDLFEELNYIGRMVRASAGIVQNDMPAPPKEDLLRWAHDMNELSNSLQEVKVAVLKYYLK